MPAPGKEGVMGGKFDGRGQNGNRTGFRTDQAISNSRFGNERTLQPWIPDNDDGIDGSLESSSKPVKWDQFAENEKRFGVTTDYDENIYTTVIDKSHPQYRTRMAAAERKAREIERSLPTTAHVAEERVMDYAGGPDKGGDDEEAKYSGVQRQDFPPLSAGGRENRYTPPAKRAPTGLSTVKGAPVDPAIITAQLRAPPKKQAQAPVVTEQGKTSGQVPAKNGVSPKPEAQPVAEPKPAEEAKSDAQPAATNSEPKSSDVKSQDSATSSARSSAIAARHASPPVKPSATSTVTEDVLKEFKSFASQQRINAEKARSSKAKADKEVKLFELKKFADSFKLTTPVPNDLVSIIAKDPAKQKEIQAKAMKNAEEMAAKAKAESVTKDKPSAGKEVPSKPVEQQQPAASSSVESRSSRAANTPQGNAANTTPSRNPGPRQYPQGYNQQQQYRNNRGGPQHPAAQQSGNLAHRLRNIEHQKLSQPPTAPQHGLGPEMRAPPTGPANPSDPGFSRRHSAIPGHMGARLNPNSNEFKPSNYSGPSAGSSPRSSVNATESSTPAVPPQAPALAPAGQLIRRKTKAIDASKCHILSNIMSVTPPAGKNWDDNGGLRPPFSTLPTWRQVQDEEKAESTMHLTYKESFEQRQLFSGQSVATPNPQHAMPQMAHQHQLPLYLQPGAPHNMGPRHSPHMPPMQMHTGQHGQMHPSFGNDDHRMMPSNSAQSYASPRLGHVPPVYPVVQQSPAQGPYAQTGFMPPGPGAHQMGQYRNYPNAPQFMGPQQGHMGGPMMMGQAYMQTPQGMMAAPQMMYNQYGPPTGPPQPVPGANGFPNSPGRPAAPMMAHQGSQQGQPAYGMSPNIQYTQPAYGPGQHGGHMNHSQSYNRPGPQHYGSSPQQGHQYGLQQRSGSNSYNKNFTPQAQHQGPNNHTSPAASQSRPNENSDESK
jgi:hypothetical protein